jgi:hypothetical protein
MVAMIDRGARIRTTALCVTLAALTVLQPAKPVAARPIDTLPRTMLWAWERPTDLRDLGPDVGVAFLAQTIAIDPDRIAIASRRWPLKVAPGARLSAVTRIEMPVTRPLSDAEIERTVSAIVRPAGYPQVAAVQIDFDATESQRVLYRRIITAVRSRLQAEVPLSITALASWCAGDRWIDGLPVDEAVPMLFDLGPLNHPYRGIAVDASNAHALCRSSAGVSLGEPITLKRDARRVYVFNPREWNGDAVRAAREYANQ